MNVFLCFPSLDSVVSSYYGFVAEFGGGVDVYKELGIELG